MYFEYNLPAEAPAYVHPSLAAEMETCFAQIGERMNKLEDALTISGLDGATFAEYAKVLFDYRQSRFDTMTAEELSEYCLSVHDGKYKAMERVEWPNATTVIDTAFVTTKEWECVRRLSIGGSDAAIVKKISPYRTRYELYQDKRGTPIAIDDTDKQAIFDRGHAMEETVINKVCLDIGATRIPETRMFASKEYPHCTANPDAIIRTMNGKLYVFEAKTTIAQNFLAWADGKIPVHYVPQTRQYPAVLNDPRIAGSYIGCLFTYDYTVNGVFVGADSDMNKFVLRVVDRDRAEERKNLAENEAFFKDFIESGTEPPLEGDPSNSIAVLRQYIGHADPEKDDVLFDPDVYSQTISTYLSLGEDKKALDKEVKGIQAAMDELKLPLIEALGQSITGKMPIDDTSYIEVKYSPRKKDDVNLELLQMKYPEAFNECVKHLDDAYRVFTVKKVEPKKPKTK